MPDTELQIRSYRVVFDLERRIHHVDRFRIPLPYGLPLRGVAYFVGALLLVLMLGYLPLTSAVVALAPVPVRLVVLPCAMAYVLAGARIDGRPAHAAALTLVAYAAGPRRLAAFASAPAGRRVGFGDLVLVPDDAGPDYRRSVVLGPGKVLLRYPARCRPRARTLIVEPSGGEPNACGTCVVLRPDQRLLVR